MATPDNTEPFRFRRIIGAIAGIGTAAALYSAEAYVAYAVTEVIKAGFQSPDAFPNALSILCLLVIAVIGLRDITTQRGEALQVVLYSGAKVGLAVNQAVLEA